MVPPDDIAVRYTAAILPGDHSRKEIKPKEGKKYGFMVCTMINALNSAAVYYKDQHCEKGSANYSYSYTFFEDMLMPEERANIKQ
jgi:hypothetical protein